MTVIDSLEFAQTGQRLAGRLPIPGLMRLRESLADLLGEIEFVVAGSLDARRRPVLGVDISGVLHLQCQRCLEVLDYPLRLSSTLLLVEPGAAGESEFEAGDAEWVEASSTLDVEQLIEDEILLSLPFAPRHEEGACRQSAVASARIGGDSPFAQLARLKRNKD